MGLELGPLKHEAACKAQSPEFGSQAHLGPRSSSCYVTHATYFTSLKLSTSSGLWELCRVVGQLDEDNLEFMSEKKVGGD